MLAFGIGSQLYGIGSYVPFLFAGVVMVICLFVLKAVIREPAALGLVSRARRGGPGTEAANSN